MQELRIAIFILLRFQPPVKKGGMPMFYYPWGERQANKNKKEN